MYYNPLDKFYKSQTGAILENSEISFRVKGNFNSVILRCKKDGCEYVSYSMKKEDKYFKITLTFESGLYFYHFDCQNGQFIVNSYEYLGVLSNEINDFQLTVYSQDYEVPSWLNGGVIYQIFPDRFCKGEQNKILPEYKVLHKDWNETPVFLPNEQGEIVNNDFFGGDIIGIIDKLDYIKSLGVNAIYLNPIFKAFSNHRYDTGDYMQIDDLLGTKDDFVALINKANEKGIKIILDGVFNHTGVDSIYFNLYNRYDSVGACQSKNSKYYSWYNFKNYPYDYDSWWGIKTLPAVNENNADYIDYITGENGVIEYYTKLGVGGWRLDVVDELPSDFVKKIRSAVKRNNKDAVIIGEVWEDASNKISYGKRREYFQGKELDSTMNYPLKNAILDFVLTGDEKGLVHVIYEQIDHYPHKVLHALMNVLSTHDTARLLTVVGGESPNERDKITLSNTFIADDKMQQAIFNLKVATLLQFTLCGVPTIYYGDEIGMQGYFDPLNRCTFPWGNEINNEITSWYKGLSDIRNSYSAFKEGNFELVYSERGVIIYKRKADNSEILICINNSNENFSLQFGGKLIELITGGTYTNNYEFNANTLAVFINKI